MEDEKQVLLRQLHSTSSTVRELATQRLWQMWFGAAGPEAEALLMEAERAAEGGDPAEAEELLTRLLEDYPDFAEGWNRRATLRYLRSAYQDSLADCHEVLRIEPDHFGAWHGLGLCLYSLNRFDQAARAFRRALEIQPFAEANRELWYNCLEKLN